MTIQVAVKLPDDLVHEIDRLVDDGAFDSRSHAIRSGLVAMVAGRRRQEIDRRYRDALTRLPETKEEIDEALGLASTRSTTSPGSAGGSPRGDLVGRGARCQGASFDNIRTFPKAMLVRRLGSLGPRQREICTTAGATLDC